MDILGKIFGSPARVKIIRIFLLNPECVFDTDDVKVKSKVSRRMIARELTNLVSAGLIRRKTETRTKKLLFRGKSIEKKRKVRGWVLDERFVYLDILREFLLNTKSFEHSNILRRLQGAGKVKLIIVSGVFLQDNDSRLDMLIVGDSLRRASLTRTLKRIESDIGRELRYGVLTTQDFLYRLDVYDRFVRDVLDFPHQKLLNKIGLK